MKLRKIQNRLKEMFNPALKKQDSLTSLPEIGENVYLFFYLIIWSMYLRTVFFDIVRNQTSNKRLRLRFFFLSGFSFTDTDDSQDSRGREGTIFYSTLPLPPAHKHSDIYLQLFMSDDYHIF